MASLMCIQTGETLELMGQHIFGRHAGSSHTVLTDIKASRLHAKITWNGEYWAITDSSTNGTFIDGKRIASNIAQPLKLKNRISFDENHSLVWQVVNITPPKSLLLPETENTATVELNDITVLPNPDSPLLTIYRSITGDWICESDKGSSTLSDGSLVVCGDDIWRLSEASECAETINATAQTPVDLIDIVMHFNVSQNEEHVSLQLSFANLSIDLGERNHHYLLLLLARKKAADKNAGFVESEQGWIERDTLGDMTAMTETNVNIQIYRLRKQIIQAIPEDKLLPQIIEKRKGEIRLVYTNIDITGGMQPT